MAEYDEGPVLSALAAKVREHGLVVDELELIRHGSSSVYRVVDASAVARVTRSPLDDPGDVEAWLQGVDSLVAQGAPVLGPLVSHPIDLGEAWATLWPEATPVSRGSFKPLGAALRRLHAAETPDVFANRGDRRMAAVVSRLETAEALSVPAEYVGLIRERLEGVEPARASLAGLPHVTAHADAYVGSLMVHEGAMVLIDLDDLCCAPRELDFAPSLVSARRFEDTRAAYAARHRLVHAPRPDLAATTPCHPLESVGYRGPHARVPDGRRERVTEIRTQQSSRHRPRGIVDVVQLVEQGTHQRGDLDHPRLGEPRRRLAVLMVRQHAVRGCRGEPAAMPLGRLLRAHLVSGLWLLWRSPA